MIRERTAGACGTVDVVEQTDDLLSDQNIGWWLGAAALIVLVFAGPWLINRSFGGEEEAAPGLPPAAPGAANP
jgi:hypothetical protein